ncbi:MAG: hypothetical protein AB7T49_18390 [Oligoflexales bacterium]
MVNKTSIATTGLVIAAIIFACKSRSSNVANAQGGDLWQRFEDCNGVESCEHKILLEAIIGDSGGGGGGGGGGGHGGGTTVHYYDNGDCTGHKFSTSFTGGNLREYCTEIAANLSSIDSVKIRDKCMSVGQTDGVTACMENGGRGKRVHYYDNGDCTGHKFSTTFSGGNFDEYCATFQNFSSIDSIKIEGEQCMSVGQTDGKHACKQFGG